jgi:hypothetical protein
MEEIPMIRSFLLLQHILFLLSVICYETCAVALAEEGRRQRAEGSRSDKNYTNR